MPEINEPRGAVQELPLSSLVPNPDQPRKQFREEQLKELAQSIREKGIIQPLIVEKQGDNNYIIIAGERRYRAASLAGLTTVPVVIKNLTESSRLEIGLIENIQREDLTAIEEAQGYRSLMDTFAYTQEKIAKQIGKSRSAVANALRLLRLPEEIQKALLAQTISAGHARALLAIESEQQSVMHSLYARIIEEGLSVRAVEEAVKIINRSEDPKGGGEALAPKDSSAKVYQQQQQQKTPELIEMEESLIRLLGTQVKIIGSDEHGKIEIRYYNQDDLNRLYDLLLND